MRDRLCHGGSSPLRLSVGLVMQADMRCDVVSVDVVSSLTWDSLCSIRVVGTSLRCCLRQQLY